MSSAPGYATHYTALGHRPPDWAVAQPLDPATPWLPAWRDQPVLDLGTGFGEWLARFGATGFTDLTGVDADDSVVGEAQAAAGARARLVQAEGQFWLESHPGHYGLILVYDVLEHLPPAQIVPFMRAAHRALRPSGRLVVRTPNLQTLGGSYSRYLDLTHQIGFTEASLRQAYQLAGFPPPQFLPDPQEPWGRGWQLWTPWRGLRLRPTLNRLLHQFVYALRDQLPRPTRFGINLEAWAARGVRHD